MKSTLYYLGYSHFLGIGPRKFTQLIKVFGATKSAYKAPISALHKLLGPELAQKFNIFRQDFEPATSLKEYEKQAVTVVTREDSLYPHQFHQLTDAPICLY